LNIEFYNLRNNSIFMKTLFFFAFTLFNLNIIQAQSTAKVDLIVDMSKETVSTEGVFVVGNFFGGTPEPLDDNGDGTWIYPARFSQGDTLFFKFKNGTNKEELIEDSGCLINDGSGKRMYVVPNQESVIHKVCYNACVACDAITTSITDFLNPIQLKVFPNPMTVGGKISWQEETVSEFYEIDLIDITGGIRRSYSKIRKGTFYFERKDLQAGIYFLSIRNESGRMGTHKIIITDGY